MKLRGSKRRQTPSEVADEGIDLDLSPMMSVMIVLIPVLATMAAFAHFAVQSFTLPPDAANASDRFTGKVELRTTLVLREKAMLVTLGGDQIDSLVAPIDMNRLTVALTTARKKSDLPSEAVLSVADGVPFQQVVSGMDLCRDIGFTSVGIGAAPVGGTP